MPESKFLERGCQEKTFLPAPREDAGVLTYIQPHLILKGVLVLAAFARRAFQRRCQPQLLIPTRRFHEAVALDAIRFRSYASEGLAKVSVGSEEARLRAGLRPPLKLYVPISGIQLSRGRPRTGVRTKRRD